VVQRFPTKQQKQQLQADQNESIFIETDEYKCYSKHFSDEIVEDEFAYFIVENYERSFRKVKEVLQKRDL